MWNDRYRDHADLSEYSIAPKLGALIVATFCRIQLAYLDGVPRETELLLAEEDIRDDLVGLDFDRFEACERPVITGEYYRGLASVIRVFGFDRAATRYAADG